MSCVEIASIIPATTWRLDALEVSLAVIFGVILGVILAIIISRCFVKELAKDRIHKHQDDTVVKNAAYEVEVAGYADMTYRKTKTSTVNEKSSRQMVIKQDDEDDEDDDRYRKKKRRDEESDDDDDDDEGDEEEQMKEMSPSGIIIALTMPSSERTLVELSLQDFKATKSMERELLQERESVFVHILQILLGRFVTAEKMDEKFAADFVERTSEELREAKESLEATQLMVEQDLKNRSDLVKDPLALEEALENSRLDYIRKMDGLVQDAQIKVKDKLNREAGLTSEEVEAIMKKLLENMAAAERMIGQEQNRQATILHERLSKRQALSEQYAQVTARENKGNQTRVRSLDEVSKYLAEERELNESQAKSIMKQYQSDVEKIQEAHKAAVLKQSQELAEKLQEHRDRKLRALEKKQEEQREKLASKAPHVVNPADFVEAHHDLLEQQRNEKNDLIDELDYHEAEELSLLRKTLEEDRVNQFTEKDKSVFEELVEKAQLNEKEANRIVKKHQANVTAYEEQLDQEKKRQNMILQEKIQLRKASWEEEQKRAAAEQQQLAEQQERTITKLIDTQSTLDEESKRQIMLQHEQNVTALNNHLQMTKLKQQKLLEAKLAKRRARYETLKAEHSRGREDEGEESELTSKQAEELQAEEQAMREEQQGAILALRKQLAQETEEVLKDQDAKMGILIGKLQVGQARRQGVIKKLDKAVKDLQDQLVDSIANSNVVSERKTERIMAAHMQEIEEIEEKLRQARAHQEDQLQHKMETIKLMREKTLAEELKQEAKPVSDSRRESAAHKSSVGALQMMTKILESNRQKQALRQLEQEMKVETLKQKEELNEQLEDALEQELKERERDFLGQLAALSQLSKEELNSMVQTAIAEDGGDENDAKKLSKDLNKRIKTAKTRPDMDPDAQEEEPVEEKPKKKKKKKAKKAPPPEDL